MISREKSLSEIKLNESNPRLLSKAHRNLLKQAARMPRSKMNGFR